MTKADLRKAVNRLVTVPIPGLSRPRTRPAARAGTGALRYPAGQARSWAAQQRGNRPLILQHLCACR